MVNRHAGPSFVVLWQEAVLPRSHLSLASLNAVSLPVGKLARLLRKPQTTGRCLLQEGSRLILTCRSGELLRLRRWNVSVRLCRKSIGCCFLHPEATVPVRRVRVFGVICHGMAWIDVCTLDSDRSLPVLHRPCGASNRRAAPGWYCTLASAWGQQHHWTRSE